MAHNTIICIARQFGSGGHNIGLALSQVMGIAFYDKELLRQAAQKSGINQEQFEKSDEKPTSGFTGLLSPIGDDIKAASYADYIGYQPNDQMQNIIADVIRDAAAASSCVIIGRCADYILRGEEKMLSVFVHAPLEYRQKRIAKMHNIDMDTAAQLIRKTDRSRANYYSFYTNRDWDATENYDLSLDAERLTPEGTVKVIRQAAELL
jgi:cytidylate kinase